MRFVLALILTPLVPAAAEANGGTLRLDKARAGPYLVSLWTQPTPPRVGILDVSVAVIVSPSGDAVLDATARLNAESLDRRSTATATLTWAAAGMLGSTMATSGSRHRERGD